MSEKSNRQPITREEYLFFLSIGYIYEGPVEGGLALRHYDTVSAPIDDYGRKYMMNAVNPVFVSDNTQVAKRGASHTTETYSYQKNYEQRKQQIKDDLKRLIAQYYADEIAKEKVKKEHDSWRLTALENAAHWLPQKVQEEQLSTAELSNQLVNSKECKAYLDMIGNKELWSWDKKGEIRKDKPNIFEKIQKIPIIGNFLYSMGDDLFITLQIIFLQHNRYHLSGNVTEGQEVLEAGIGTIASYLPFQFPKFSGIAIKPMNVSQWQKSLIFSKKIVNNKVQKTRFTKRVNGNEAKRMYNQYKNTIYNNNALLKDLKLIQNIDLNLELLNSIYMEYEETK